MAWTYLDDHCVFGFVNGQIYAQMSDLLGKHQEIWDENRHIQIWTLKQML